MSTKKDTYFNRFMQTDEKRKEIDGKKREQNAFNFARELMANQAKVIVQLEQDVERLRNKENYPLFEIIAKQAELNDRVEAIESAKELLAAEFPGKELGSF